MGQSRPLFVYFRHFLDTISIIKIEKSLDGVLGIRTRSRTMVGADETTELWGPPCSEFFISYVRIPSSGACSIILYGSINYGFFIMNYVHILLRKCFMKKAQEGLNCNFKYDLCLSRHRSRWQWRRCSSCCCWSWYKCQQLGCGRSCYCCCCVVVGEAWAFSIGWWPNSVIAWNQPQS